MKEHEIGAMHPDGDVIFREGDKGDSMYVIQSGSVKITKRTGTSAMTVATLGEGEIFGEMALFDRRPRSATATTLGETCILTIDKKKLFANITRDPTLAFKIIESLSQRIRLRNEEFARLEEHNREMMHTHMDVDEIITIILEESREIVEADNGSIMLYDPEEKVLKIKSAFGKESEPKVGLKPGEGIAGHVFNTGKAELIKNVTSDIRFIKGELDISSILCAPLKKEDKIIGVIYLSRESGNMFEQEDLKMLLSLSKYSSVAIENAMNFSSLHNATKEYIKNAIIIDF